MIHYTAALLEPVTGSDPKADKRHIRPISEGDFTCFPATDLRNAVVIARRLGVQYLWIDSLCVIQNDETD